VVLRIYQLRTDEMFKTASFDDLFDQEQRALGATLISRNEFRLRPSETRTVDVTVAPETRFVAALAAFRQINDARWRVFVPAPRGDFAVAVVRNAIEIRSTVQ
jgi:type VI secretion system protein VasD